MSRLQVQTGLKHTHTQKKLYTAFTVLTMLCKSTVKSVESFLKFISYTSTAMSRNSACSVCAKLCGHLLLSAIDCCLCSALWGPCLCSFINFSHGVKLLLGVRKTFKMQMQPWSRWWLRGLNSSREAAGLEKAAGIWRMWGALDLTCKALNWQQRPKPS